MSLLVFPIWSGEDLHKTTVGKLQGLSRSIEECVNELKRKRKKNQIQKRNLLKVYLTLFFALLASAIGAYIHMVWNIGGNVSTLGFSGVMIWLRFTLYEPNIVLVTAFVGTAVAFVCFSAAAMLATRREYLYLGASLACCMSILWWVQIASSIFGGSTTVFKFGLYFGLLIFVGYIVVDTQMITEKAHHGDMDYVQHSFTFFTDFASLFVQILVLNMFRKMKKGRKDRRN
ncbi:hypothetical protein AXX17_AT4G20660 [Arabidopsis thaliana]|uniref:Bax inhibitor-1 family protein n=1 Tax=Arabidopsis thaliana TaxID=3702 RepID=A0A178V078_ARATH|nr:hypothetical protein AXX17_AT4G20660 [Arabidopsis thaliana]